LAQAMFLEGTPCISHFPSPYSFLKRRNVSLPKLAHGLHLFEVPLRDFYPDGLRSYEMSRVPTFNSPYLLGFDDIERALDRVAKASGDGYPPYNIERLHRTDREPERLRITLAVAGFTRDQLEILLEEGQLVIRGRQVDDKTRQYLHRGIAARQFQRVFLLAEGMEVLGADLAMGLLSVDLVRPEPERIIRRIDIVERD
jgi:HSP20 family molecular chaperone IbpA